MSDMREIRAKLNCKFWLERNLQKFKGAFRDSLSVDELIEDVALSAYLDASKEEAQSAPGFVLVPVEMTDEMAMSYAEDRFNERSTVTARDFDSQQEYDEWAYLAKKSRAYNYQINYKAMIEKAQEKKNG